MKNKVTIIGAGMVGSTIAHSLIMKEIAQEIAIIDITGKIIQSSIFNSNNPKFTINKKGIYFVKIQAGDKVWLEKVVYR